MDQRTFEGVIDDLAALEYCGRLSPHFYGEPLLDKRLPELIKYVRCKLPNCYISMSTNGDFLKREICEELIKCGIDRFIVTNYDDEENSTLNMLAAKFPYYIYLRSYKEIGLVDRAGEILKRNKSLKTPCLRPSAQLVINWSGDVVLCCQDYYGQYTFGNVKESHLMSIWNNEKFKMFRDDLAQGKRSNVNICKFCDYHGEKPN